MSAAGILSQDSANLHEDCDFSSESTKLLPDPKAEPRYNKPKVTFLSSPAYKHSFLGSHIIQKKLPVLCQSDDRKADDAKFGKFRWWREKNIILTLLRAALMALLFNLNDELAPVFVSADQSKVFEAIVQVQRVKLTCPANL